MEISIALCFLAVTTVAAIPTGMPIFKPGETENDNLDEKNQSDGSNNDMHMVEGIKEEKNVVNETLDGMQQEGKESDNNGNRNCSGSGEKGNCDGNEKENESVEDSKKTRKKGKSEESNSGNESSGNFETGQQEASSGVTLKYVDLGPFYSETNKLLDELMHKDYSGQVKGKMPEHQKGKEETLQEKLLYFSGKPQFLSGVSNTKKSQKVLETSDKNEGDSSLRKQEMGMNMETDDVEGMDSRNKRMGRLMFENGMVDDDYEDAYRTGTMEDNMREDYYNEGDIDDTETGPRIDDYDTVSRTETMEDNMQEDYYDEGDIDDTETGTRIDDYYMTDDDYDIVSRTGTMEDNMGEDYYDEEDMDDTGTGARINDDYMTDDDYEKAYGLGTMEDDMGAYDFHELETGGKIKSRISTDITRNDYDGKSYEMEMKEDESGPDDYEVVVDDDEAGSKNSDNEDSGKEAMGGGMIKNKKKSKTSRNKSNMIPNLDGNGPGDEYYFRYDSQTGDKINSLMDDIYIEDDSSDEYVADKSMEMDLQKLKKRGILDSIVPALFQLSRSTNHMMPLDSLRVYYNKKCAMGHQFRKDCNKCTCNLETGVTKCTMKPCISNVNMWRCDHSIRIEGNCNVCVCHPTLLSKYCTSHECSK